MKAGQVGGPKVHEALEKLCRAYWHPLYAFVRKQGQSHSEAQDLTQSFFEVLLKKNLIGKARQEAGRFRSFLLRSFMNFRSHQRERDQAQKRGGGYEFLSCDQPSAENGLVLELADASTPETVYELTWALTVLKRALARTEEEYRRLGDERTFKHLHVFLQGELESASYAQLGETLGMTEGAIKVAVHRMRKRYAKSLIKEISDTVASEEELQDVLRHLRRILSG